MKVDIFLKKKLSWKTANDRTFHVSLNMNCTHSPLIQGTIPVKHQDLVVFLIFIGQGQCEKLRF